MVGQLDSFKHYLETFAAKHQNDIKKDKLVRGGQACLVKNCESSKTILSPIKNERL